MTAVVNGQTIVVGAAAGTVAVPWTGGSVTSFTVQAKDAAGNLSTVATGP